MFFDPALEIIDRISKENAMTDKKNAQKRKPDLWCSFCLFDHVGFEICALSSVEGLNVINGPKCNKILF